jgi:phosphoglycerate dehydrogenase-like enzyme
MQLFAVRRRIHSEAGIRIVPEEELTRVLGLADHVINILPENQATLKYINARRIGCFKPGACYYGVGRGATTDQDALLGGLLSGRIGSAYLDATVPEPLPPNHPLWSAPNCYITPHTAGGRNDEDRALVEHFLANLAAFLAGGAMRDRVV